MKLLTKENLAKHSYIRIGGETEYFAIPETVEEIFEIAKFARDRELPFYVIGGGSNILFPDEGYKGVIISTENLNQIRIQNEFVVAQAGLSLPLLVNLLQKEGLSGMEELCEIPGTVGGAVAGNAGAFGKEISEVFVEGNILTFEGKIIKVKRDDLNFSYRSSILQNLGILLDATFRLVPSSPEKIFSIIKEIKQKRRKTQPVGELTLGSVFRNPPGTSAGFLIEKAGLKGYTIGGAKFSEKHANFIVNFANAKASDVKALIKEAKKRVSELFGIELNPEIIILEHTTNFKREANNGL
ncbi:MAG: UDP-N-acetylmuramate dehydrogenase [Candidatus Hydrothermia bacterium]